MCSHRAQSSEAVGFLLRTCVPPQERTGVKMVMIQDGPLPTGADKPLRITGDAFKVQVGEKRWVRPVPGVVASLGSILVVFLCHFGNRKVGGP